MLTTKPKFRVGEHVAVSSFLVPDTFTVAIVAQQAKGDTCFWCDLWIVDGDPMEDFHDPDGNIMLPENWLMRI